MGIQKIPVLVLFLFPKTKNSSLNHCQRGIFYITGTPYRNRTDDQSLGGTCYIHLTKGATLLLYHIAQKIARRNFIKTRKSVFIFLRENLFKPT